MNKLSSKNKLLALGIITMVGVFIIYQIALKETLVLHKTLQSNKQSLQEISNTMDQVMKLEFDLHELQQLLAPQAVDGEAFKEMLLSEINSFSEKKAITLRELPEKHLFNDPEYTILTYSLLVEGGFINLQRLVYFFETGIFKGFIRSVNFTARTNPISHKRNLVMVVYFQIIIQKHESTL